jgi:hypothetical protein
MNMEYIKLFIVVQILLFALQFSNLTRLPTHQYYEMVFGSFLLLLFFGFFGAITTLDSSLINRVSLFASLFGLWYYATKRMSNFINSDSNGVIYNIRF